MYHPLLVFADGYLFGARVRPGMSAARSDLRDRRRRRGEHRFERRDLRLGAAPERLVLRDIRRGVPFRGYCSAASSLSQAASVPRLSC
jgi:hypothetical protein